MPPNANFAKSVYANATFPKRQGTDITQSMIANPKSWFGKHAVGFDFDENAVWTAEDVKTNPRSLLANGASNESLAFPAGFRFDPVYVSGGGGGGARPRGRCSCSGPRTNRTTMASAACRSATAW